MKDLAASGIILRIYKLQEIVDSTCSGLTKYRVQQLQRLLVPCFEIYQHSVRDFEKNAVCGDWCREHGAEMNNRW